MLIYLWYNIIVTCFSLRQVVDLGKALNSRLTSANKGAWSKCSDDANADSKYVPRPLDSYRDTPSSHILASSSSDILAPATQSKKKHFLTLHISFKINLDKFNRNVTEKWFSHIFIQCFITEFTFIYNGTR